MLRFGCVKSEGSELYSQYVSDPSRIDKPKDKRFWAASFEV